MSFEFISKENRRRRDSMEHYVGNVDVENGSIDASQVTWNVGVQRSALMP